MPENNQILSVEGQLVGMPLAGPESFSQQQLDYLKRALGVDETVLWSGNEQSGCTLSESCRNFEKIIVKFKSNDEYYYEHTLDASSTAFVLMGYQCGSNVWLKLVGYTLSDTQITAGIAHEVTLANSSSVSVNSNNKLTLLKVVGIHRIAGGN